MKDEDIIKEIFESALLEFKRKDLSFMNINSSERAKVHRIAMYMECFIKKSNLQKYVVDCEYNLVKENKKKLPEDFYGDTKKHNLCFMPDLIVHVRNEKDNLFCCEFKNKNESTIDLKKIKFLIENADYEYKIGSTIVLKKLEEDNFLDTIKYYDKKNSSNIKN